MVTRRFAPVVPALVLALAGCGGSDDGAGGGSGDGSDGGDERRSLGSTDGPTSAYLRWVDALAAHDAATACDLQAPDLTIQLRADAILVHRAELGDPCVGFEALLWEDPGFDSEVTEVEVTQETSEDAVLAVELASRTVTVRMVYHRAHWRVLSTSARTDASADPARWVASWCGLSAEDSRDEILAAMGRPSGEYTVSDGGEPQLWWAQDQYDFRVYLDPVDGSVLELVGDYDALSEEDRAQLPCPELRS